KLARAAASRRIEPCVTRDRPASPSVRHAEIREKRPYSRSHRREVRSSNAIALLSKLAVHETGVERAAYDADAVTTLHQITVEANPCDEILQHLQSVAPVISAHRVPERRSGHEGRAACARLFVLGPIRGDAVRPTRTRQFVARDLWRLGELRGQAVASR